MKAIFRINRKTLGCFRTTVGPHQPNTGPLSTKDHLRVAAQLPIWQAAPTSVLMAQRAQHHHAGALQEAPPVSWFSTKVTAREGHMPRRPGGRPWLSISRQYSLRPMASCRMPAAPHPCNTSTSCPTPGAL